MQIHQVLTLCFAVMKCAELQPVDRPPLSCGIQIFVRFYGSDDGPFAIDVTASATVQDVIDQIVAIKSIPKYSTITCQGRQLQTKDILSECGVVPESVVEITPTADIEKLFDLFDDPADLKTVFGFENYNDFQADVPLQSNKDHYFSDASVIIEFNEEGLGNFVQRIEICGGEEFYWDISSWKWDVLEQFEALEALDLSRTNIGGVVPFGKLPRGLKYLNLCDNKFDQILDDSDTNALPPNLEEIHLDYPYDRQFKGFVKRSAIPHSVRIISEGDMLTLE